MVLSKKQIKHPRASAILTTIFLLFGITAVAMIGIEIIMNGLMARRVQGASLKAFYAAESGAERALSVLRVDAPSFFASNCKLNTNWYLNFPNFKTANPLCQSTQVRFDVSPIITSSAIKAQYWVRQAVSGQYVTLMANGGFDIRGNFERVSRQLNVTVCIPNCSGGSGSSDGCGSTCS